MTLLMTLTSQWELSREKEMTQKLLFYSQSTERKGAKVFSNAVRKKINYYG